MKTRLLSLALTFLWFAGCGGSSDTQKAAVVGWAVAHGGVVTIEGRTLEVESLNDLPSGDFEIAKIDLTEAKIQNDDLKNLSALPELKALTLHSTEVTDEGLNHLQALENLKELDLTNTNISDAGLKALSEIESLEKLHLHNTAVTKEGIEKFRSAVPGCELFHSKR